MKTLAVLALLTGTAVADPVLRGGALGGVDTAAPGNKEDGVTFGAGWRYEAFTAELDYAYLDYDGSTGVGGYTQRIGVLAQAALFHPARCEKGDHYCPHVDLDLGVGRRWINWTPSAYSLAADNDMNTVTKVGSEYQVGVSVNMGLRLSLHYVVFKPDEATTEISCRGTCPMRTVGNDTGLLLEASFAWGG